jgi:hypothetical protein
VGRLAAACGFVALLSVSADAGASVTAAGTFRCRVSATKLGPRIEVTYRLVSSDPGHAWRVRMWNGGVKFVDRTRVTDARGRLRIVGITKNRQGLDEVSGIARDRVTGGRCVVDLSI